MRKFYQYFLVIFIILSLQSIFITGGHVTVSSYLGNYMYLIILIIEILGLWNLVIKDKKIKYLLLFMCLFINGLMYKSLTLIDLEAPTFALQINIITLIIYIFLEENVKGINRFTDKWLALSILVIFMIITGGFLGSILEHEKSKNILMIIFNLIITFYCSFKMMKLLLRGEFSKVSIIISLIVILIFSIYNVMQYIKLSKANNILDQYSKEIEINTLTLNDLSIKLDEYEKRMKSLRSNKNLFVYNQFLNACPEIIEAYNLVVKSKISSNTINGKFKSNVKIDEEMLKFSDSMSSNLDLINGTMKDLKGFILISLAELYILVFLIYKLKIKNKK